MPEEDPSKFFLVSLVIQQLAREILSVADELGGRLNSRVMFYCEEMGTLPAIASAEMLFSAARSRMLSIIAIVQSHMQMAKNYGQEGAKIIMDNCGLFISGGFAPSSDTADLVSKALGSRTVMSGSVSRGQRDPSQSLQMMERPLMTADELRTMEKGRFIVMKIGQHPVFARLKLFFKWGISFDGPPYEIPDKSARRVAYASREGIEAAIRKKYPQPNSTYMPEEADGTGKEGGGATSAMRERPHQRLRT
jgi:type IV secretion system protein VirD4